MNDATTRVDYALLGRQLDALLDGETDALANTANFVGLLFAELPDVNWAGVYVQRDPDLVLGPFQGKPACVRIGPGEGVCGAAAAERRTLRVADVEAFPGHIACDPASRSELVVPLVVAGRLLGVLDVDSPVRARFDADDERGIEGLCRQFLARLPADADTSFI